MTTSTQFNKALAWRSLLETYSAIRPRLETQMMEEENLRLSWYDVLSKLIHFTPDGRQRMQDLANSVFLLTPTGLTRALDRMEAEGLVIRVVPPGDRRGVEVQVTDEGRRVYDRVNKSHGQTVEELFLSQITDDEARVLFTAFARVIEHLKGAKAISAETS